jgi:hypothetical protein
MWWPNPPNNPSNFKLQASRAIPNINTSINIYDEDIVTTTAMAVVTNG